MAIHAKALSDSNVNILVVSEIPEYIDFKNRGVLIGDTYVLSDIHIGYSDEIDAMTKNQESSEIASRLTPILEENDLKRVIVNGDIFHEFNIPSEEAREIFREMESRVEIDNIDFITVRGNHDSAAIDEFPHLANFVDYYKFEHNGDKIIVCHGHETVDDEADLYIVGHLHPTLKINGVSWPAYLFGRAVYNGSDVLVLPPYSSYQDGVVVSDRMRLDINFPFVGTDDFEELYPIVFDENQGETREFPKLKDSADFFGM